MKRVSLFVNKKRDPDGSAAKKTIEILKQSEIEVLMTESGFDGAKCVSPEDFFSKGECVIALGGDGTILNVCPDAAKYSTPILGINFGTVGFMSELEKESLEMIKRLKNDDYKISERMMLEIGVGERNFLGLNECSVISKNGMKLVNMKVFQNDDLVSEIRADGVIFSTPTGSTGYAFSAGGAVMDPEIECISMQTICSYYLKDSHQMVFSPKAQFTVSDFYSENATVCLCVDGRNIIELHPLDKVTIRRSENKTKLITFEDRRFYHVFYNKF